MDTPTALTDSNGSSSITCNKITDSFLPENTVHYVSAMKLLSENIESIFSTASPEFDYFSDAKIVVGDGRVVSVHRCILSARSAFFKAALSDKVGDVKLDMKELTKEYKVSYEALVTVLTYIYSGKIRKLPKGVCVCADEECDHVACRPVIDFVVEVLYASFTFQISELFALCQNHLLDILDKAAPDDTLVVLYVANMCSNSCEKLFARCMQIVVNSNVDILTLDKALPEHIRKKIMDSRIEQGLIGPESNNYPDKHVKRIHRALDSDDVELLRMLLKEGNTSLDDACALHYAVAYCDAKTTTELLDLGLADVNHTNSRGYTVLHVAATRRDPKIIVSLLTKGARPSDLTLDGRKALQICKRLTRALDYQTTEKGIDFPKDRLCIEILEQAESRDPLLGEASVSLAMAGDDLRMKLLYLERPPSITKMTTLTFPSSSLMYYMLFISFLSSNNYINSILTVGLPINIWPKPTTFTWTHPQAIPLSPSFTITSPYHKYLTPAVNRYRRQILKEHHTPLITPSVKFPSSFPLKSLKITVTDISAPLIHGVSESYNLTVPGAGTAVITAATPWAAMRGLETFSQLVWGNPGRVGSGLFISDSPLFGHRGVLLDTSRNFFSVDDLMRLIKGISMNKMNVFHWHITDSHSFPIVVPSEPKLSNKGSYGGEMVYTPQDVKRVVEFGFEHGVRVLPEIDMPGHTGSWAEAYPEIVACAKMFWWPAGSEWADRLASEPGSGQLNPLNPKTYEVVKNVIRDVTAMFPEPFFHAGADEVVPGCWKVDKTIQSFLANNGTLSQVLEIFVNTTYPFIVSQNRTVVYWEDVMLDDTIKVDPSFLPKETTILQTWNNGPNNTKRIVNAGYRAIVSSSDFYYLDCGHGGFVGNDSQYAQKPGTDQGKGGSWCAPFKTWQTIYNYDITYGLNKEQAKLVLGGEVALWTEQADSTVLDSRVWPRASAMAEALWSGNVDESGLKRYAEATDRLIEWRHRMVNRGIGAEAIQPLWCIRNPTMCNTVQDV